MSLNFLILFFYLILNRISIGKFIGHYGADKHFIFSPDLLFGNGLKYLSKYLIHPHFWSSSIKFNFYGALDNASVYIPVALLVAGYGLFKMKSWKNQSGSFKAMTLFFVFFVLSLAPVITLFFSNTLLWENDRYGYLASAFIVPFIILLLYQIPWKSIRFPLMLGWVIGTIVFFSNMIDHCNKAGKLQHALLNTFNVPGETENIYILGSPDNYRGLYLFRDYETKGDFIRKSLKYLKGKEIENTIHHSAQFNSVFYPDRLNVKRPSTNEFIVSFAQGGNWFWKHGIGLSSYQNEHFTVTKNQWNYALTILSPNDNDYIIWSDGLSWKGGLLKDIPLN